MYFIDKILSMNFLVITFLWSLLFKEQSRIGVTLERKNPKSNKYVLYYILFRIYKILSLRGYTLFRMSIKSQP